MGLICLRDFKESSREQVVIAIKPTHQFTCSAGKALNECVGLARVALAVPIRQMFGIALDYFLTAICTATIQDH